MVEAGCQVVNVDLRGCGESTAEWDSYTRTSIAHDLLAVVERVGAPAVLCGHSISGGAATIAAAIAPNLVTAVVEIAPFTRKQTVRLKDLRNATYRRSAFRLLGASVLGNANQWLSYLDGAYPGEKPDDFDERKMQIKHMLSEPGRMKALRAMGTSAPADAGEQLRNVRCPVLIVQGGADPDWVDPKAEGEAIVAELPSGLGRVAMIDGAGHYPHVQHPVEMLALVTDFLSGARA